MIATGYGWKDICTVCGKAKRGYSVDLWTERNGSDLINIFLCEDCKELLIGGLEVAKEECEVEEC